MDQCIISSDVDYTSVCWGKKRAEPSPNNGTAQEGTHKHLNGFMWAMGCMFDMSART